MSFVSAVDDFSYKIGNGEFWFSSYGVPSSLRTIERTITGKGLTLGLSSNLPYDIYDFHLEIEGCDNFDYKKPIKKGDYVRIFNNVSTMILNCPILEATNNKTIKISYKDEDGVQKIVEGWLYFTIPEATYINDCSEISEEKIIAQYNCEEKFNEYLNSSYIQTRKDYKQIVEFLESNISNRFCYDKENNILYYVSLLEGSFGTATYFGGGVILYYRNGVSFFEPHSCYSIKKRMIKKCADTLEEIRENFDSQECKESEVCFKGACVKSKVCPAEIKFETDGSIIAPGHYPGVFVRTYEADGNPVESVISFYEYFNSEKTAEGILEIPKRGFKIKGIEKEKFEPGSYKIVLNSPVSGCKTEEIVKFTMKESMSAFDRISEFFRWVF